MVKLTIKTQYNNVIVMVYVRVEQRKTRLDERKLKRNERKYKEIKGKNS